MIYASHLIDKSIAENWRKNWNNWMKHRSYAWQFEGYNEDFNVTKAVITQRLYMPEPNQQGVRLYHGLTEEIDASDILPALDKVRVILYPLDRSAKAITPSSGKYIYAELSHEKFTLPCPRFCD
jgi:hypothetical protein